jgi:hypothetical protein
MTQSTKTATAASAAKTMKMISVMRSMTLDDWYWLLQVASAGTAFVAFVLLALTVIAGRKINARDSGRLLGMETDLVQTKLELSKQQERAAKAEQDVLAVRRAMVPRRIIFGSRDNDESVRAPLFEAVAKHTGTLAVLQWAPELEAQALAGDIAQVLKQSGWKVRLTSEAESRISNVYFATGVHIFTMEHLPAEASNGVYFSLTNPSTAGKAAQALESLLKLDLGPPHGPPFAGVRWEAQFKEAPSLVTRNGFAFPNGAVVIVIGTRPIEEFLSTPANMK